MTQHEQLQVEEPSVADALAAAFALRAGGALESSALRADERAEAELRHRCRLDDPLVAIGFPVDGVALR